MKTDTAALHKLADDYYAWRNENYPVHSSDSGLHTWDNRLTDYSPAKIAARAQHVSALLEKVRAMQTENGRRTIGSIGCSSVRNSRASISAIA